MPKLSKKQSVLKHNSVKRKKVFKEISKQEVAAKKRRETRAVEITFVGEGDVVSEQIPPPAESASSQKLLVSDKGAASDEDVYNDLEPAEGYRLVSMDSLQKFVTRIHACDSGKNLVNYYCGYDVTLSLVN